MPPTTPRSAAAVIGPAFEHATRQLLRPFRAGQWLRLGLVGFLAGEAGPGGCNLRVPWNASSPSNQLATRPVPDFNSLLGPQWPIKIAVGVVLIFIVFVVFAWVGSRMRFVLFDSVVSGECHVRTYWRRRELPGWRYFVFQLLFGVGSLVLLGVWVGGPLDVAARMGGFTHPAEHVWALVVGGLFLLVTVPAILMALTVVQVLIKDFVVPQMALDGITVSEGWRRLASLVRADTWSYAAYLGVKCLLAIAYGIVILVPITIALLIIVIPIGGIGALVVAGAKAAGLMWNPLTIGLAVTGGGVALLVMLAAGAVMAAPGAVFFPAYSMYFFADRYPALATALQPPTPPPA